LLISAIASEDLDLVVMAGFGRLGDLGITPAKGLSREQGISGRDVCF
jgi:hypothetical protein